MDYQREDEYRGGNVVQIIAGNLANTVNENRGSFVNDQTATWNREALVDTNPNSNYDGRLKQSQSGSKPPNKRTRNFQASDVQTSYKSNDSRKIFYKTKLCCKFPVGTCSYITRCNFAHGMEELRKPPRNLQEIVDAHVKGRGVSSKPMEEFRIPVIEDTHRSYKGRYCKKFCTEEGCPYGENCTFLHDEESKTRESVVISLGHDSCGSYEGNENVSKLKPSNRKTKICNKWELTGYCPYGSKCHFAHGVAELHHHGGGHLESGGKDASILEDKQGAISNLTNTVLTYVPHVPYSFHIGTSSKRLPNASQKTRTGPNQEWKGPDKLSKIYGDWIDDL